MSSKQASHSTPLLTDVQHAIAEATYLATGYDINASGLKHCHVQMSSNYRHSGDMKTNVAASLFYMHIAKSRDKCHRKSESRNIIDGRNLDAMEVVTTSPYGLEVPRRYDSVASLAESIILLIPEEAMESLIAHAFVQFGANDSSHIVITTKKHLRWHLDMDKLHCVTCGKFFKGSRGLRTHEIIDHKISTENARQDALDSELQVVLYVPPVPPVSQLENLDAVQPYTANDLGDEGLNLAKRGEISALRSLIAQGLWSPHDVFDRHGHTCLTWAAGEGHLEVCRFLVNECGMDPLVMTGARKRRRQALHWAARNGRITVCEWLIKEHGADVNAGTDDGTTPLHLAIWNNQPNTVKWLIECIGCDINRKNSHGCNASQWAALNGDIGMLIYLKDQGLDLTLINANGRSAVHKAGLKGHLAACQWLLKSEDEGGAGLSYCHTEPDIEGDTPASLARSNGHTSVEQWLIKEQSRLAPN